MLLRVSSSKFRLHCGLPLVLSTFWHGDFPPRQNATFQSGQRLGRRAFRVQHHDHGHALEERVARIQQSSMGTVLRERERVYLHRLCCSGRPPSELLVGVAVAARLTRVAVGSSSVLNRRRTSASESTIEGVTSMSADCGWSRRPSILGRFASRPKSLKKRWRKAESACGRRGRALPRALPELKARPFWTCYSLAGSKCSMRRLSAHYTTCKNFP